ncbi:MAG: hypothetical protein QM725_03980 [Lacibacter sp.]
MLANAQQGLPLSNLRTKKISTSVSPVRIDTVSIVPNSVFIAGYGREDFQIDEINAKLTWLKRPSIDTVTITYRVFPYKLNASVQRMNFDDVKNNFITKPIETDYGTSGKGMFDFGNVNYNGSFGRGISFGNNQDAVVNGLLNLQINGMIGDSMQLSAALTDNNIPIQAEGNTQQLNEFDRVWIQLKKKGWQLNLGDIDIRKNDAYFLNFYKRLQGISFLNDVPVFKNRKNSTLVSGAIAKGKFSRYVFQGLEGNQGPYRLQGPNGELFFIVLAGTERVFIDGELMQRGEDQDYVINYNTAEVTFTPKRMITKDRRIQVEFEYADRNFLNSQFIVGNELKLNNKFTVRINAFSNADSKNSSVNQVLTKEQKQFMFDAGDKSDSALYSSVAKDTFDVNKIVYRLIDTIVNSITYQSVLVYTVIDQPEVYSAAFTDAGNGNGDYILENAGANGRVYKWVAPVNNVKQGRYVPAIHLVAPRTQQMLTVGADYKFNDNLLIKSELAMSRYDVNTLSSKDKANDDGWAGRMVVEYADKFKRKKANSLQYKITGGYEYVQKSFKALERLRAVEFTREWGLPVYLTQEKERIINGAVEFAKGTDHKFSYSILDYKRGEVFSGLRHNVQHSLGKKGWTWLGSINYSSIDSGSSKGFFARPSFDLKKKFDRLNQIEMGAKYYLEHSQTRNGITDSLSLLAFMWDTWTFYVHSKDAPNKWGANFYTRRDKLPFGKEFEQVDRSFNYNAYVELMNNEHHQFRLNATLRELKVYNAQLTNEKPEHTLLGRAEYFINEWKGMVTGNVLYEAGSGQEQRRDYSFLEVPAGQGQYTWNDYNNDGIPQLNEFEIAVYKDQAKYIRIYTPTLDFIKANYNQFNYNINLNPRAVIDINKAKGLKKMLSKIAVQSSMQLFKKEISDKNISWNPFSKPETDTSLISLTSVIANTLFFNRASLVWGVDITHLQNTGRSILTYGLETKTLSDLSARFRWNKGKHFTSSVTVRSITNRLETPKFGNRNYNLKQWVAEPSVSYLDGTKYRFTLNYKFEEKNNIEGAKEKANIHSVIAEMKYSVLSSSTINGRFQFSKINFTGVTNSTVAFIMLDALLPGKNYLWSLNFSRRLSNNMKIDFQYEGRKPGTAKTVHTGSVGVSALF